MLIWCKVAGTLLSVGSSFVVIGDHWDPFHNLLGKISGFGKAERGWEKLYHNGVLTKNDTGFQKLLHIILRKRPGYSTRQISEIICREGAHYKLGEGEVLYKFISLRRERQSTPDVIGSSEQVEGWISEARLRFVLSLGFCLLSVGSLLRLLAFIR